MKRTYILDDKDFWLDLEFRLSGDLQQSESSEMRRYWVDGFLPSEARNTRIGLVVQGKVWMAISGGSGAQDKWDFQLSLPQNMLHKQIRSYVCLIRHFDEHGKLLDIEISKDAAQPAAAVDEASPRS